MDIEWTTHLLTGAGPLTIYLLYDKLVLSKKRDSVNKSGSGRIDEKFDLMAEDISEIKADMKSFRQEGQKRAEANAKEHSDLGKKNCCFGSYLCQTCLTPVKKPYKNRQTDRRKKKCQFQIFHTQRPSRFHLGGTFEPK